MTMNEDQATLWNGTAGSAWVDTRGVLDRMLQPFEDLLLQAVPDGAELRVLDVGCGTGAVTRAVARRLGPGGSALGIDISQPMLEAARASAAQEALPAAFVCADAQDHRFDAPGFDLILSRFGVMFFEDPVRAFENLRSAATPGGRLRFVAWRGPALNPFMTAAERAAAPLLPTLPARQPGAPGQFAFEDAERVRQILEQSGWLETDIQPIDVACVFPERELLRYVTRLGPLGRVFPELDERRRNELMAVVRPAFDDYVFGEEVRFTAACWLVEARTARTLR